MSRISKKFARFYWRKPHLCLALPKKMGYNGGKSREYPIFGFEIDLSRRSLKWLS